MPSALVFICGIGVGLLLAILVQAIAKSSETKTAKQREEEKERSDPANWWKFGGDPFAYDTDEDD